MNKVFYVMVFSFFAVYALNVAASCPPEWPKKSIITNSCPPGWL